MNNPTNPTEIQSIKDPAEGDRRYYPIMLDISDQLCFIVGGGAVAERKAKALLEAGARVTMLSPSFTLQLEHWEKQTDKLLLMKEAYRSGMSQLQEALLLFAATDDHEVNEAVRLEGQALGKLVNSADAVEESGFIVPATVRRGKLLLTVSTSGASPAVARKIRGELEITFGEEYELYLDLLQELRNWVQTSVPATKERQEMFRLILDWPLLQWIRSGASHLVMKEQLIERLAEHPTAAGVADLCAWLEDQLMSVDGDGKTCSM